MGTKVPEETTVSFPVVLDSKLMVRFLGMVLGSYFTISKLAFVDEVKPEALIVLIIIMIFMVVPIVAVDAKNCI